MAPLYFDPVTTQSSAGLWPEGVEGTSAIPSGIERSLSRQVQWTAPRAREGMSGLLSRGAPEIMISLIHPTYERVVLCAADLQGPCDISYAGDCQRPYWPRLVSVIQAFAEVGYEPEYMPEAVRSAIAKISRGFVQAFEGVFEVDSTRIPG